VLLLLLRASRAGLTFRRRGRVLRKANNAAMPQKTPAARHAPTVVSYSTASIALDSL